MKKEEMQMNKLKEQEEQEVQLKEKLNVTNKELEKRNNDKKRGYFDMFISRQC